jgi:hypothetical protein
MSPAWGINSAESPATDLSILPAGSNEDSTYQALSRYIIMSSAGLIFLDKPSQNREDCQSGTTWRRHLRFKNIRSWYVEVVPSRCYVWVERGPPRPFKIFMRVILYNSGPAYVPACFQSGLRCPDTSLPDGSGGDQSASAGGVKSVIRLSRPPLRFLVK